MYKILSFSLGLLLMLSGSVLAQNSGAEKFKTYINDVVQKVEETESAEEKRAILNRSFDRILDITKKVEEIGAVSEADQPELDRLKADVLEKKNELNGENDFKAIPDNRLNHFANYVQQDMEQADPYVTISLSLLILIAVLLLLL